MSLEEIQPAIDLLNEKYGANWVDKINVDKISMLSSENCILSQLYGNYTTGLDVLGTHIDPKDLKLRSLFCTNGTSWKDYVWAKQNASARPESVSETVVSPTLTEVFTELLSLAQSTTDRETRKSLLTLALKIDDM